MVPRVAFIAGSYAPAFCGIADYTENLRGALVERGVHSTVLTTIESARAAGSSTVLGAVGGWDLGNVIKLAETIEDIGANVVHVQYTTGRSSRFDRRGTILLLPVLLRLRGVSAGFVTTVHENYRDSDSEWHLPALPRSLERLVKRLCRRAGWLDPESGFLLPASDAVVVTTPLIEDGVVARMPWMRSQTRRIPIGSNIPCVPTNRAVAFSRLRAEQDWPSDALVMASFGFLSPDKDLDLVLHVLRRVIDLEPKARLLLLGGLESRRLRGDLAAHALAELEGTIAKLRLGDRVRLTGYRDRPDVSRYLIGSDIGVMPFRSGTSSKSGSLMAMMEHCLPTVATRGDPPDPDLENMGGVRMVPRSDPDALAHAWLELLASPRKRGEMRAACGAFAPRIAWSRIAEQHDDVYRTVLRRDAAQGAPAKDRPNGVPSRRSRNSAWKAG